MWSIVRAGGGIETPQRAEHRNGASSHAAPGQPEVRPEANGAAGGAHVEPASGEPSSARSPLLNVYLHPGRMLLESMPASRAAEQFDLRHARDFNSLGEAEAACDGRTGFLLELLELGESINGRGVGNVRFVARLRD